MAAEIGILIVHGIGTQTRGETIVNLGEPLYRALKKWIESPSTETWRAQEAAGSELAEPSIPSAGTVEMVDAVLIPAEAAEPPHVRLRIATDPDSQPVEWVMAECHWANSFPPPRHRTVTLWLMQVAPWIAITFVARRLRMSAGAIGAAIKASPRRWLEVGSLCMSILMALVALPLIGPLVLVLELCLIALLIAGLVPLKVVGDFVARINAVISSVLGDSFIYASSQMRQKAVISKLRTDLKWLESKWACKYLVVIAHSQGAALSYLSLIRNFPEKVRLLVTFGSGLLKLHQLSADHLKLWVVGFTMFLPMTGIMFLFAVAAWLGFYRYPPGQEAMIWGYTGMTIFFLGLMLVAGVQENTDELKIQTSSLERHGLKWIDAYASMDPVPNGPLFLADTSFPESVEICNRSSFVRDHTSYAENADEFLLLLLNAIGQYSGTALRLAELTPYDKAVQANAKRHRQRRIASTKIDEYMLFAALVGIVLHPDALQSVGMWLGEGIAGACNSVNVKSCWQWPPVASGLLLAAITYVFLSMCVQTIESVSANLDLEIVYSRSTGFYNVPLLTLFSHMIGSVTLSLVALLYYSETFSWFEVLYRLVPNQQQLISVRIWQGFMIGLLIAFALAVVDLSRFVPLLKADPSSNGRAKSD